jgi:TPR repeat protein
MRIPRKAVLLGIALAVGLCAVAAAGPMEDADAALKRGDYATAAQLYRSQADQGRASAQHFLAKLYENGQGVPRSSAEAAKWYRRAADQGHTGAQFYLAGMYSSGEGVPQDLVQAYMWFSLSAQGAQSEFANSGRAQVARKMTPAQIADAERRINEWKPTKR